MNMTKTPEDTPPLETKVRKITDRESSKTHTLSPLLKAIAVIKQAAYIESRTFRDPKTGELYAEIRLLDANKKPIMDKPSGA
jgi:hypothetical protein